MAAIVCPLKEAVAISGKETALVQGESVVLYSQLDVFVSATAGKLLAHGVTAGDAVALRLEHRIRSIVLILACIRIQAVACPLSPRIPNSQIGNFLSALDAKFWIDDFPWPGNDLPDGLQRLESDEAVGQLVDDMQLELPDKIELNRPATMVFTSGSSAQPKAAVHNYGNHYYSALGANPALRLKSHCKWLLNLPLYHVSGLSVIFRCLKAGAAMVLPADGDEVGPLVEREGVTHLSAVPTQLYRYLQEPAMTQALKGLRVLLVGGAPLGRELLQQALAAGIPVHTCYGLTETASLVTLATPDQLAEHPETSGKILRYRELRLDGKGEIWVRGSTRFAGYRQGDHMEDNFDEDGWLPTGDSGELNEHSLLSFKGRKDWMFISGGENIHPEEIESAILQLPGVSRAIVIPVPDEEFGFRPLAVIDRSSATMNEDQIKASLAEFLPRFKIPQRFVDWPDELPVEEGMKLDRKVVQEWALTQQ